MDTELIYKEECYAIIGACFNVYKDKGCGFLEPFYQECMEIELNFREIPHVAKPRLELSYRNRPLNQRYEPDFICHGKIIVELKATTLLADEHRAQVINYLRATGFKLGLLVNFGHYPRVEFERLANAANPKSAEHANSL